MKAQQSQQKRSRQKQLKVSSPSPNFSKLVAPALAVLVLLGIVKLLQPSQRAYQLNLKDSELGAASNIQNQATAEAPRYGLQDLEVHESRANLILWDNGLEDGDFVTVKVNGQVYANNFMLHNSANSIPINLNPGANLVQIYGNRDGGGGITLAAQVSDRGNLTDTPFPEGATAMFYIFRR